MLRCPCAVLTAETLCSFFCSVPEDKHGVNAWLEWAVHTGSFQGMYKAASLCFTCKVLRGKVLPCWILLWGVWEAAFLSPLAVVEAGWWPDFCTTGCPHGCSTASHHSSHLSFRETLWFPQWQMWNCTWAVSPALWADGNSVVNKEPMLVPGELPGLKRSHSSHSPYAAVHRAEWEHLFLHHHLTSPIAAQHRALPWPGLCIQVWERNLTREAAIPGEIPPGSPQVPFHPCQRHAALQHRCALTLGIALCSSRCSGLRGLTLPVHPWSPFAA